MTSSENTTEQQTFVNLISSFLASNAGISMIEFTIRALRDYNRMVSRSVFSVKSYILLSVKITCFDQNGSSACDARSWPSTFM